jgi:hypothetical protein
LILATPFHGRAIPCHFVSYSSRTINDEATSRNQHHFEAFAEVKHLLGDKPLVLDREFSYFELMENLVGFWKEGFSKPLWVMTNLDAEQG